MNEDNLQLKHHVYRYKLPITMLRYLHKCISLETDKMQLPSTLSLIQNPFLLHKQQNVKEIYLFLYSPMLKLVRTPLV